MNKGPIILGLLAHVDAGKTTLAESLLYKTGAIRKAGRVDHRDAFLDTHALEKRRGITIFAKQAQLALDGQEVTLLDTPGHADFSAEMERTLQVLDYAVLVISGADGIQGQVGTLWRLLERYQIPTFLFVNKMDQPGTDRAALLRQLQDRLDAACVDFGPAHCPAVQSDTAAEERAAFEEELATCDEETLERYLETGALTRDDIRRLIRTRKTFPCYFGSALKMTGVDLLLEGLSRYMEVPVYPEQFGARVFKVAREGGVRLTYLKVTGGTLKGKQMLAGEKVDQIRLPGGASFIPLQEAAAGTVCAVSGPVQTFAGQGFGTEEGVVAPVLEPVLTYTLSLPEGTDAQHAFRDLKQLNEEIPELHLTWESSSGSIRAQVMGEVQIEILRQLIQERFGLEASFGAGCIVYRETIRNTVEGVGHFEPLRHYAEVHLILEPLPPGSGVVLDNLCRTDDLDLNWQRLILTHLAERRFCGVLTGSELTDVRITLTAGRAHLKHTEGGDFRQATYRAVRQGLMQAQSTLLEPVYAFRLEVPQAQVGRAMSDIQSMHGSFDDPVTEGELCVLTGTAPVACMQDYMNSVRAYTQGSGRLTLTLQGYAPCHNTQEVLEACAYDPDADTDEPSGSVFCSHGAGVFVPWMEVPAHMHLEETLTGFLRGRDGTDGREEDRSPADAKPGARTADSATASPDGSAGSYASDRELMEIFARTYGRGKDRSESRRIARSFGASSEEGDRVPRRKKAEPEAAPVLLVDGYNIIFAWEDLKALADRNLDGARTRLADILANYRGFRGMELILVFDAYRVAGGTERSFDYHGIHVVYTKEAETADAYIERTTHELRRQYDVTVATSDAAEQIIIWGQGAKRMSARELREEVADACRQMQENWLGRSSGGRRYLFDNLSEDLAAFLEEVRLGRETI